MIQDELDEMKYIIDSRIGTPEEKINFIFRKLRKTQELEVLYRCSSSEEEPRNEINIIKNSRFYLTFFTIDLKMELDFNKIVDMLKYTSNTYKMRLSKKAIKQGLLNILFGKADPIIIKESI